MCTSVLEYEEWKDITGYEGLYQVSSFGRIKALAKYIDHPTGSKSFIKEKILTGKINNEGYCIVTLTKNKKAKGYLVHRLVAEAFIDNPNNYPVINHIWENQKSNNNKNNLEWCSVRYNNCYGSRLERIAQKHRKKVCQYNFNGELIKIWDGLRIIARELNVSESNVSKACKGKYKQLINYVWRYEGDAFDLYDTPTVKQNEQPKEKRYSVYEDERIIRYDLNGNVIKEYNNINEASIELKANKQCLLKCCNGELITSYNSIWRFKNDRFNKYQTKKPNRIISNEQIERLKQIGLNSEHTKKVSKRVGMYDLNNNFIKEYCSVTQAVKENGTGVIEVLNGRQRKTHGLIFKFI